MSSNFDRYVSFLGADWESMADRVLERINLHIEKADSDFWPYFQRQRDWAHRQGLDDLRVFHNFLPTLKELLESLDDHETLALLVELEEAYM